MRFAVSLTGLYLRNNFDKAEVSVQKTQATGQKMDYSKTTISEPQDLEYNVLVHAATSFSLLIILRSLLQVNMLLGFIQLFKVQKWYERCCLV